MESSIIKQQHKKISIPGLWRRRTGKEDNNNRNKKKHKEQEQKGLQKHSRRIQPKIERRKHWILRPCCQWHPQQERRSGINDPVYRWKLAQTGSQGSNRNPEAETHTKQRRRTSSPLADIQQINSIKRDAKDLKNRRQQWLRRTTLLMKTPDPESKYVSRYVKTWILNKSWKIVKQSRSRTREAINR